MICQVCKKERKKTFRREGATLTDEQRSSQLATRQKLWPAEIRAWRAVCWSCLQKKMEKGNFYPSTIIRNPTIKQTGDGLEWIPNE